jgi:branched-chain amino acid transport system permease protein
MSLLTGLSGMYSFGQSSFFGLGAYTSAIMTIELGLNPWLAMLCAAIITAIIAAIISIPLLKLAGFVLAVATIAFNLAFVKICEQWTSVTNGHTGLSGVPDLSIGGLVLDSDTEYFYLIWIVGFILIFFTSNMVRSRVGRAVRSIHPFAGGSERAAQSVSISPQMFKTKIFTLCAIYCSLAGSLYAHWIGYVNPSPFYVYYSIQMLVMAIVGGERSLWGPVLGAGLLIGMTELIREIVPYILPETHGDFEIIVYGVILILVLMYLPMGLASIPEKIRHSSWYPKLRGRIGAVWGRS